VRHDATVQVRRGPRKVKSSFSLRTPCVTSLRVDDDNGIPVAWQRLVRPRSRKRGHGRLDPLFRLSGSTLFSPNHPSSLKVPFCFGAASFRGCYHQRQLQPAEIVCKCL
ncbi:hypothetical protein ALC57_13596, partial [Trachymyrmex cornetzi]